MNFDKSQKNPQERLKEIEKVKQDLGFEGNEDYWHEGLNANDVDFLLARVHQLEEMLDIICGSDDSCAETLAKKALVTYPTEIK